MNAIRSKGNENYNAKLIHGEKFICPICNAGCGLIIKTDEEKKILVLPDKRNPLSRGYCCPKGIALGYITQDRDRIRTPLKRVGKDFKSISWKKALHEIAEKLSYIREKYSPNAIAYYMGTNSLNHYAHSMFVSGFMNGIGSKNLYNAGSVDNNNIFVAHYFLYGNSIVMPIPDLPNTDLLIIIGSNPAVTNLSLITCANVIRVMKKIKQRGGEIYVIDPRRNETVKILANNEQHYIPIVPNTDIFLLLAMMNIIFTEGIEDKKFLKKYTAGADKLKDLIRDFTPEAAEKICQIKTDKIYELTRKFVETDKSVIYSRLGICLSAYPTLNAWAVDVLNIISGKLDKCGGYIFGYNVINIAKLGKLIGMGKYDQYRSRIGNYPDVMGAFPLGILAREILSSKDPVRALLISAGNPVLSAPNSNEFIKALKKLELCVVLDFYINETALIAADYILPVRTPLENKNFSLFSLNYQIFPHIDYNPPIVKTDLYGPKPEWEILLSLTRLMKLKFMNSFIFDSIPKFYNFINKKFDPEILVKIFLLLGQVMEGKIPYLSQNAITLKNLKKKRFILVGKNRYNVLKKYILTKNKKINLVNDKIVEQIQLCKKELNERLTNDPKYILNKNEFLLIGGRNLKTMNSWMHNVPFLWRNKQEPRLMINPVDAKNLNINDEDKVRISTNFGYIDVPVIISEDIIKGSVFYPHGWGHKNPKLSYANQHPGENINKLTDSHKLEKLSGMPIMNGYRVKLIKI